MPIRRTLKNVVKNYSDAQVKVREATSNDPWGPSSTLMSEIADLTYNVVAFTEIMQMVWKRLNDHGKNWRHVYKALVLLDYLIKTGSEKVAQQCKENIFAVQTLKDFQYVEDGKDHGMNVRERAKQLVALLKDDERLKNERAKALKAKERFAQSTTGMGSAVPRHESGSPTLPSEQYTESYRAANQPAGDSAGAPVNAEIEAVRPSTAGEEELQLQLALAMSREEHEEDEKRRKTDEVKYQMAIDASKEGGGIEHPRAAVSAWGGQTPPDGSLLELSSAGGAAGGTDPWGGSSTPLSQTLSDPWASPAPPPYAPSMPMAGLATNDPWGGAQPPAQPLGAMSNDLWAPSSGAQAHTPPDPWGSPKQTNGTHTSPGSGIDEEFDLLTRRSKTPPLPNSNARGGGAFDMGGMGMMSLSDCEREEERKKNKSPHDFLGENANLVNLDNLVTKPAPPSATNPFALTIGNNTQAAANPFASQTQPQRVPMNQMTSSASSSSIGFVGSSSSSSGAAILPTPLMPVAGGYGATASPMQPVPAQSSNPFL